MSALTQRLSLAPAPGMPGRVRFALLLLWVAWVGSACGLGLHLYQSWRAPLDLYSVLGFPALLAQALLRVGNVAAAGRRTYAHRAALLPPAIIPDAS